MIIPLIFESNHFPDDLIRWIFSYLSSRDILISNIAISACCSFRSRWKTLFHFLFSPNYKECRTLTFKEGIVTLCELSDQSVAISIYQQDIQIWDLMNGVCKMSLRKENKSDNHASYISQITDTILFSSSFDGVISLWDLRTYSLFRKLEGHEQRIYFSKSISAKGLLTASEDGSIRIWSIDNGNCELTINHEIRSCCLISEDEIALGLESGAIEIWPLSFITRKQELIAAQQPIACLQLLNGKRIMSYAFDRCLRIWSLENSLCLRVIDTKAQIASILPLSDGKQIACREFGKISIWNIENVGSKQIFTNHNLRKNPIIELANHRLAGVLGDRKIGIWNISTGELERVLKGHKSSIQPLIQLSDGKLISGSDDHTVRVWDPIFS